VPTYPLAQLLQLRQSNVRQLERKLANDLAAVNDAEIRVADLETRRETLQSSVAAEQQRQLARGLQGAALVQDFVQGAAYQTQQQCEHVRLKSLHATAVTELEGFRAVTRGTEQLLAQARRQLAAVERHQQRFLKRCRQLQAAQGEEDAAEAWQAANVAHRSEGGKG
jgi:hypothetical protein